MAAMEEIEALLHSLQALKAPGVTPSKINAITAKCVDNVQSDTIIVEKIQQQFDKSPATHKLGVLYVVDSIARQWKERARLAGQAVSKSAAPGTFASGVQKITDMLPNLMTDLIQSAPQNQREKISKLLDIWERAQTFPQKWLTSFKQVLTSLQNSTHTLPSTSAASNGDGGQAKAPHVAPIVAPQDTGSLLAALAIHGQQNAHTNLMPAVPPAVSYAQASVPQLPPAFVPPPSLAANAQPALPPFPPAGGNDLMNQILPLIANGTIPPDQVYQVLALLAQAQSGGAAIAPPPPVSANTQPVAQNGPQPSAFEQNSALRYEQTQPAGYEQNNAQPVRYDQNGAQPDRYVQSGSQDRYEQNGSRYRDRSRSPDSSRRHRSPNRRSPPPNRRDSPTYGVYDPNAGPDTSTQNRNERGGRGRGRQRGGRNDRNEYRQRTPPAQRRQSSPTGSNQPKFLEWDKSMPREHIKVLSRTLFVGGAGGTEAEIRAIFSRFGKVQTCIVNQEKRHAFVKMVNRRDAISAKEGMDNIQDHDALSKARQTRWGVGFGPRDCSDYATGVSIIPITRLTDADRKWVHSAEFGGTGGRQLEGGMVIEEPDIEIGAGVSSKAISRRVPPEAGRGRGGGRGGNEHHNANHAPRGGFDNNAPRFRQPVRAQNFEMRHSSPRPEQAIAIPPAIPGFGFQLPGF